MTSAEPSRDIHWTLEDQTPSALLSAYPFVSPCRSRDYYVVHVQAQPEFEIWSPGVAWHATKLPHSLEPFQWKPLSGRHFPNRDKGIGITSLWRGWGFTRFPGFGCLPKQETHTTFGDGRLQICQRVVIFLYISISCSLSFTSIQIVSKRICFQRQHGVVHNQFIKPLPLLRSFGRTQRCRHVSHPLAEGCSSMSFCQKAAPRAADPKQSEYVQRDESWDDLVTVVKPWFSPWWK